MKKICKITWLHNGNYGSVLQALALQKFILDNNYEIVDIDYKASSKTKLINWWKNKNSLSLFWGKYKEAKIRKSYAHPELFEGRAKKFDEFKNKNIKLTNRISEPGQLDELINAYDVFICGSDQIWSPMLLNPVFYLDFVPENKTKIAYAPSFGVLNATEGKMNKIKQYINRFQYLSVRETQGQELVNELINQDVPVVVDPTMLLSREIWENYASNEKEDKKYIFCYLLTPNEKYIEAVTKLSKEKNLPVIIVPTGKGPFETGFEERVDAGPAEWLSYIKNAELVCTDSFHGCIFSSIFNTEFILFKRFADNNKKSENSRVYTLTKLLETEERLIDADNIDKIKLLKPLDFVRINENINREADKSGKWLLNILNQECK